MDAAFLTGFRRRDESRAGPSDQEILCRGPPTGQGGGSCLEAAMIEVSLGGTVIGSNPQAPWTAGQTLQPPETWLPIGKPEVILKDTMLLLQGLNEMIWKAFSNIPGIE